MCVNTVASRLPKPDQTGAADADIHLKWVRRLDLEAMRGAARLLNAALAVEAWQLGELSEGQLARFLRTDRIGARETVHELEQAATDGRDSDPSIDLAAPLFGPASR